MKKLIEELQASRYRVIILGLTDRLPDNERETTASSPKAAMINMTYRLIKDRKQAQAKIVHLLSNYNEWSARKLS